MIGCGNKIIVAKGAVLDLGANTKITDFCNIDCWTNITIGDGSTIAHRSQIMDSNHHSLSILIKGLLQKICFLFQ